jgi:hypothetical protein
MWVSHAIERLEAELPLLLRELIIRSPGRSGERAGNLELEVAAESADALVVEPSPETRSMLTGWRPRS